MASTDSKPSLFVRLGPFAWLAALGLAVYTIFAPSGYLDYRETKRERQRLEEKLLELETENRRLQEESERLLNDKDYLERIAREKLGMVYPDEKLVIVPRAKP